MVPKIYLVEMSLFAGNPKLAESGSYSLGCEAHLDSLKFLLDKVYNESSVVDPREIAEDNFDELKALLCELGFSKLDTALRMFEAGQLAMVQERVYDCELMFQEPEDELVRVRADREG